MPIEIIDEKKISKIINSMINERKDIERNNNNDNNLKINNKNIYVKHKQKHIVIIKFNYQRSIKILILQEIFIF